MMPGTLDALTGQIVTLAGELPPGRVHALAEALQSASGRDWGYLRLKALQVTAEPRPRSLIDELLDAWRLHAPEVAAGSVALALLSAAAAGRCGHEQSVDLVWTGPDVADIPLRRTDQALLQVIDTAERSLLIVSFAVYRIPAVAQAIVRAAGRGVAVTICLEAPEPSDQRMSYDTVHALGPEVQACANVYIWPRERRPVDPHGNAGVLHAKCAVADERMLFVSSANLTEYAMNLNMELGVLIQGGRLPGSVGRQFERMIQDRVLTGVRG